MAEEAEKIILKVAAQTSPPKLAGAIVKNLEEGKQVYARAYGSQALYQLDKAADLANRYVEGKDEVLVTITTSMIEAPNYDSIREFTHHFRLRSQLT